MATRGVRLKNVTQKANTTVSQRKYSNLDEIATTERRNLHYT